MADTNSPIDIEIIAEGTELTITLTDAHYKRLQELLFGAIPFKDLEHLVEIVRQIKANDYSKDPLAYHVHTVLSIMNLFEDEAKKQGKISKKLFDPATQKIVP